MNNIIRKIKDLYPVSDNALKALTDNFEQVCFPAKSRIISAGTFDRELDADKTVKLITRPIGSVLY